MCLEPILHLLARVIIHVVDVFRAIFRFWLVIWRVGIVVLSAHQFFLVSQTQADIEVILRVFIERRLVKNEVVFVEEEIADEYPVGLVNMWFMFEDGEVAVVVIWQAKLRTFNQEVITRNSEFLLPIVIIEDKLHIIRLFVDIWAWVLDPTEVIFGRTFQQIPCNFFDGSVNELSISMWTHVEVLKLWVERCRHQTGNHFVVDLNCLGLDIPRWDTLRFHHFQFFAIQ